MTGNGTPWVYLVLHNCNKYILTKINGASARCMSRFTGRDVHEEASVRTRSYDLVGAIKRRRLKYLGHILRMEGKRLVKLAVEVQFKKGVEGNIFMNVPKNLTYDQIVSLAQGSEDWKNH